MPQRRLERQIIALWPASLSAVPKALAAAPLRRDHEATVKLQ